MKSAAHVPNTGLCFALIRSIKFQPRSAFPWPKAVLNLLTKSGPLLRTKVNGCVGLPSSYSRQTTPKVATSFATLCTTSCVRLIRGFQKRYLLTKWASLSLSQTFKNIAGLWRYSTVAASITCTTIFPLSSTGNFTTN